MVERYGGRGRRGGWPNSSGLPIISNNPIILFAEREREREKAVGFPQHQQGPRNQRNFQNTLKKDLARKIAKIVSELKLLNSFKFILISVKKKSELLLSCYNIFTISTKMIHCCNLWNNFSPLGCSPCGFAFHNYKINEFYGIHNNNLEI